MKKIFFLLIFAYIFSTLHFAFSAIVECQVCSWQDLTNSLTNLIKTVVWFSFWIAVLLSTIGAFLIMLHGPKPDLYQKGKNLIITAIIGYILLLLAGVIFDIILEFFAPRFDFLTPLTALASDSLTPTTYLDPLKSALTEGLKCGAGSRTALERLFSCAFEALALLKNFALILLTIAIIGSAAYLITTPLFGFKNIGRAYQILIWSIIGLIIILLADVIKAQIERLTK